MKLYDPIRRRAVALLPLALFLMPSSPLFGDIFPVQLLTEQATLTNLAGANVAISADYLAAAGIWYGGRPQTFLLHRENGAWQLQSIVSAPSSVLNFGQAVALQGTTAIVGAAGRAYVFGAAPPPGLNAWSSVDQSSSSGVFYNYAYPVTPSQRQLAASEGWTLTVRCRMVDNFNSTASPSCFADYAINPTNRFLIFFNLDANRDLVAQLSGFTTPLLLTTNGGGWGAYHTHQIVFDPTNGTADYFFDGFKMNPSPWPATAVIPLEGVRFGNGSSTGKGSMNFNLVQLTTHVSDQVLASYDAGTAGNPATAPDPQTQGWTFYPGTPGSGATNGPVSPDFASLSPLQAVLAPDDTLAGPDFGQAVAIGGNTVLVGSPGYNDGSGRAYVFAGSGSNWVHQAVLQPGGSDFSSWFGAGVALDGDTAVVGAPHSGSTSAAGSAYVFVRNGTNWTPQQQLTAASPEAGSRFGGNVAIDGDRVAVGALWENHANNYAGAVYVFGRTNAAWSQQGRFFPADYPSGEDFGQSLALKGDVVVASGDYYPNSYIFALGPAGWVQAGSFAYTDNFDPSIRSVAMSGQDVVVSEGEIEGAGGAVRVYSPDYGNATNLVDFVAKFLYYPNAASSLLFDPNQAAFRYKTLLYAQDTNGVRAQFTYIASLYGQAERDRAASAESELARGLAFHPADPDLGNLLLDIYYDRTVAQTILARDLLAQATAAHFPSAISHLPTPDSGFVIDNEIPLYEQVLATNRYALAGYFTLFTNDLGVAGSPPLGYRIFTNLVPTRGLMPATYLDTNGVVQSVTPGTAALFDGYKDIVLLFNQLQDYGESTVTLGKLLLARAGPGDDTQASNTVGQAQQLLFLDGALLKAMFANLPDTNDPSGLAQSIDGWSDSLSALTTLRQSLVGGANLLGFAPDFLMYVYSLPGQPAGTFNSYDALRDYLDPNNGNNGSHPLSLAVSTLQAAKNSYASYLGYQDQLADQMTGLNQNHESRLRDIVGAYPGDPTYGDNPTNNAGSLLDQQYLIIQQARLKILHNHTEMSNLRHRVDIEINRAGSVSNVVINYGNKNASIEETLGHIEAGQAAANGVADTANNVISAIENPVGAVISLVVNAVNAGVQAATEERKGELQAEKERNSAMEQAQIEGINSAAAVKTMLLDMNTLLIESQEAALQLQQAVNQLAGLYREKQQLEQKITQENASLATRYYADPIHRLQAQADMVGADLAFNNAQKWLFFMERALAYKWNIPLDHSFNGITWTEDSLFKLRNADELNEMFDAMNDWDSLLDATLAATQTNVDYFSVRDDFLGYTPTNRLGEALTYADPITGQPVGAIQAFRDRLRQLQNTHDPNNRYLDLRFSTVRQIPGKSFFQGPIFAADGSVVTRGLCLDKIQWIKINLPGPHTFGGPYLQGTLTYGGTSFIRNLIVGAYDPARPDQLANEMTAYDTRRWYFSPAQDVFTSEEAQSTSASMQLSTQAGVIPSSTEVDVFNERSVATSAWRLTVPTTVAGTPVLSIDQLDDIEIWFKHIATDRITQ